MKVTRALSSQRKENIVGIQMVLGVISMFNEGQAASQRVVGWMG
jgi:hypothetical protein